MIDQFDDKSLGVVFTPPTTVEYIISRMGSINKDHKILDPCAGPGIFVKTLLEKKIDKNQICAFEVNPNYKTELINLGISVKIQDTLLALFPDSYSEFDFIVGNPPYLNKSSSYVRANKKKLQKIYGKINAHETYAMFIVNSIWRLKNGGKLGFITSDSFLTLNTHTRLRKFILNTCKIDEILLAPKDLFNDQDVSTSTAIIILTKCDGKENLKQRRENIMRIVPRLANDNEYQHPNIVYNYKQQSYELSPFNLFFTEMEKEIVDLFETSFRLENHIRGYIGMHTHDNLKYIAAVEGTELAEIFKKRNDKIKDACKQYKIIPKKELENGNWKPYLKRGGAEQYYRPIMEALEWTDESIPVYDIPENVPFEEEGIVISGISSRLAARYMPKGCYWDSNKAIGFKIKNNSISIEYALALLNSSLYNYLAKGILNNTNSIQITGIHALPFIIPDNEAKTKIEHLVRKIIENKKINLSYDYIKEQKQIDDIIFNFYAKIFFLSKDLKKKLDEKYSIYAKY